MKFSNVDKLIVAGFAAWGAIIAYSTSEMLDIFTSSKNGEKKKYLVKIFLYGNKIQIV